MAHDRDRWRVLENTATKSVFYKMRGISWLAEYLVAYQKGLCPIESVSYL